MTWFLLLAPLLAAGLIAGFTRPWRGFSAALSIGACAVSFALSLGLMFGWCVAPASVVWMELPGLRIELGFVHDRLAQLMLVVVTGVGLLIHIFSLGYMREDAGKSRFFAQLSLFMFSMIGIVISSNFVQMFLFWELVGLSSYLLIGFWFHKDSAAAAANKAFFCNRLGDFGFMLGILLFWTATGSVMFDPDLKEKIAAYPHLTAMALLLFCGCAGKSAQFPLHVWLPDAMEGPTPVSALIHAATMVAAGVYMLCRIFFVLELAPVAMEVIAWIGGLTALMAALWATQQNDIKRILAFSTLSQLGYMVMAVGCGGPGSAMFHLMTHAFFKAMLFLAAGSIIHALHHEQDIWKMGGLRSKMPVTFATFLIGTLALTGFPYLFSGFYSKDAILATALHAQPWLFAIGLGTAFLTAFYMFRLVIVVFFGTAREGAAGHAHESPAVMTVPLLLLAVPSIAIGYPFFHVAEFLPFAEHAPHSLLVIGGSITVALAGILVAIWIYGRAQKETIHIPAFAHKFYFDELYDRTLVAGQRLVATVSDFVDQWVIGYGLVRGASIAVTISGEMLRLLQAGNLRGYAFLFAIGASALFYWVLR